MRKILKVKTVGSKAAKNLKPIIADVLPQGVNMTVHLYNEVEGVCICEVWGSNKDFLKADDRISEAKLNKVLTHTSVLEQLDSHPSVPEMLYQFSDLAEKYEVDETTEGHIPSHPPIGSGLLHETFHPTLKSDHCERLNSRPQSQTPMLHLDVIGDTLQ